MAENDNMIEYKCIMVNQSPYCFWDSDLRKRNLEFINSLEPKYYDYIARHSYEQLESEHKHFAALSLRTNYYHALETLFALICSTLQAPDYNVGWFLKYRNEDLREMVRIIDHNGNIPNGFKAKRVSWDLASEIVNRFSFPDAEKNRRAKASFSKLWSRFASDFLDGENVLEYNNIKHGLRSKLGGFSIAFGIEDTPGVAAPPEKMQSIGGSEFGSKYFVPEKMFPKTGDARNLKLKRHAINWHPDSIANKLILASMSIQNITSILKIMNGVDPTSVLFTKPEDDSEFEQPWNIHIGVLNSTFDIDIEVEDKHLFTKEQIISKYLEDTPSKE